MKVAILAGGRGTRFAEQTLHRPKPMIEIGGRPILWHIMMHYYRYGHSDFAIALGYKGDCIKRWLLDMARMAGDLRVSTATGAVQRLASDIPDWTVDLIETGTDTNTGGRIGALAKVIGNERFMLTWGDGVSNLDLDAVRAFHQAHGKLATVTVVRAPPRFGRVRLDGTQVVDFEEKPEGSEGWINAAFFVLEPEVFGYIDGPDSQFERGPLQRLSREGQLMAYQHHGFWHCMDTAQDKAVLDTLWASGHAPWMTGS